MQRTLGGGKAKWPSPRGTLWRRERVKERGQLEEEESRPSGLHRASEQGRALGKREVGGDGGQTSSWPHRHVGFSSSFLREWEGLERAGCVGGGGLGRAEEGRVERRVPVLVSWLAC